MADPRNTAPAPATGAAHAGTDEAIVQRAAQWMARLWADDASDADRAACAQWRAAHPDHERAWHRLLAFDAKLQEVPRHAAPALLQSPAATHGASRRRILQTLALCTVGVGTVHLVRNSDTWRWFSSDYNTHTGQIREIALDDGTRVLLDTASAFDVHFGARRRELTLRSGGILVTTGRDSMAPARPFSVRSREGSVLALGTRFSLRQEDAVSHVAVFDGAVEIKPVHTQDAPLRLEAGRSARFSDSHIQASMPVRESDAAWSQGLLVANNMRVQDFLRELERYRTGLIHCDPDVADMRVSGVFPVTDTDRALNNLKLALPVEVIYRTRYWVAVQPVKTS
ncbi:DUF4880 domain-containing protein [Allopusillimonas soli]|uniref:FecR domain-containing protein n=1 Tax=Allopusillimonas soli TaxID=659016 RepID=A0A853F7D8_9BURK|nr:FecR domain-containing protein [Allopusillimonas soli]NYT35897.1 FecR domain-containing protein [Allopusillimonas soli]TEA76258.1 DUF4880 domain-containing protein [Allopusillimonas soli]